MIKEVRGAAHSICNSKYSIAKEITVIFHNVYNYNYHFIIYKLAEEFEGQINCLRGNAEKYITFSVAINYKNYILQTTIY